MKSVSLKEKRWAVICIMLGTLACGLGVQAKPGPQPHQSPQQFVEDFYQWYVPTALKSHMTAAWSIAVKEKASSFDPKLAQALKDDSAAQAKAKELVGLSYDPFLNTQDPGENYKIDGATRKGQTYLVNVFRIESNQRGEKPDVVAELSAKNGSWHFINFHYPDGTNLLSELIGLKEDRRKRELSEQGGRLSK